MTVGVKRLLISALTVCFGLSVGAYAAIEADAEQVFDTTTSTKITDVNNENLDNGKAFIVVLSNTDYMTATEWSNADYKWLNDEEISSSARGDIDLANNNVCNAKLDQNLDQYNFEEYIYIDGVSLASFSETHPYTLYANRRTRVNTFAIDFENGVMDSVSKVEIREGCQLPTLSYGYIGGMESSCLLVEETVAFVKADGVWDDFFGYEENTEYYGDETMFQLSPEKTYKGHKTVPLTAYTDFFMSNAVQGELLDGRVTVSASNTEKGNLMVLNFVHPIDVSRFNQLNLRVYINHQIDILTYNADAVTEGSLGPALESFTVGGGVFSSLSLNSALYVDDDNQVSTIVFQFVEDCAIQYNGEDVLYDGEGNIIRDTFHFVSFNLAKDDNADLVSNDSFMIIEGEDAYELTFRFNKIGTLVGNEGLDTSKVLVNGYALSQVLAECKDATAEWYSAKGIYQINIHLPKSYTGAAQIKNEKYSFAGNNMGVVEGLLFPNGDVLEKTYTCHLYAGEKIVDCEMVNEYKEVKVEDVTFSFVTGSQNIHFTIYFDKEITSSPYYHACEGEHWRSTELKAVNESAYDEEISKIFVDGGYKTSLLDHIVVNGLTLGEWHAHDSRQLTNVQVHYGNTALNCVDVFFEKGSPNTYNQLYDFVEAGNGITIEVKSGLKFMSRLVTQEDTSFTLENGTFVEQIADKPLHVYFDGIEVSQGDILTVNTAVSEKCISVEGVADYEISSTKNGNVTEYTIVYGNNEKFVFSVVEESVAEESEGGCSSAFGGSSALIALASLATAAVIVYGRKHREENGNH